MAKHIRTRHASRWSGTPDDLRRLALDVQASVRSASRADQGCSIFVRYKKGAEGRYDTPDEFIKELDPTTIRRVKSVMLLYGGGLQAGVPPPPRLSATVWLQRRDFIKVRAEGDEPSIVDGLTRRLVDLCGGLRLAVPGMRLRRSGEVPRLAQLRARIGTVALVALTAAITAAGHRCRHEADLVAGCQRGRHHRYGWAVASVAGYVRT
jgi:hypothetical protein